MDIKLEIKIDAFNGAMKEMAHRLKNNTTGQRIVEYEVVKVLEKTLAGTDAATVNSIRGNFQAQQWTTFNGRRYNLDWHFPNGLWNSISAARKANLQRRLAARGLAKRSFHALGLSLGYDIDAPAYVKGAVTRNHTSAENVSSRKETTSAGFGVRIEDHSPLLQYTGAKRAFFAAVAGRVRFFTTNVAKGVFNDLKQVTAKYPGLRFTP
jgi:hypothetical protein